MKIFQFKKTFKKNISYKTHGKIGKIKHLVLFDYELLDKICDNIKYLISKKVVLQIVLIIILERTKLIHIILCPLKEC